MVFSAIIKGLTLGLVLSISVGPVIFAIIKQSLSNGHKGGIAFVLGVSFSDVVLVVVCNVFSQLFASAMQYEKEIGIGGSVFLIILGLYNFFFKKNVTEQEKEIARKAYGKRDMVATFFSGFIMNILNPAVMLFWFAVTATILNDSKSYIHDEEYRLIVFATCLGWVLAFDLLKVFLAGKIRNKLTPHNIHKINQISGIIFVVFGIVIMYGMLSGKTAGLH